MALQSAPPELSLKRPVLQASESRQWHRLRRAALEWGLADPIVLHSEQDIKGGWYHDPKRDWNPFEHQVENLIASLRRLPVAVLADDVGLGKTISAGMILSELMVRGRVQRTLVVCPKILQRQWVEELGKKFKLKATAATGSELTYELRNQRAEVVVTTYHTISRVLERGSVPEGAFQMLILDEAHKLRNLHGTPKPPKMAVNIQKALKDRLFPHMLLLTATPMQNRITDLYSLLDLAAAAEGRQHPLGHIDDFRFEYLLDGAMSQRGLRLRPDKEEAFHGAVRRTLRRTRRVDVKLNFPSRDIESRTLKPRRVEKEMIKLVREVSETLSYFEALSLCRAMMSSPHALATQVANSKGDWATKQVEDRAYNLCENDPVTSKMAGLLALVDELAAKRPEDWRLVVFTLRVATQDAIGRMLRLRGVSHGFIRGGTPEANAKAVEAYTGEEGKPPSIHVLVSTDSGAEGVNLQAGNVILNFDLPWNPMVLEQRIGRVQRMGSTYERVEVVNLAVEETSEEMVVKLLTLKLEGVNAALGDIEAILDFNGDPDGEGFEKRIGEIVMGSLRQSDQTEAFRREFESQERAKKIYAEVVSGKDDILGTGNLEDDQPRPPKFEKVEPTMDSEELVLAAYRAFGHEVDFDPRARLYRTVGPSGRGTHLHFGDRGSRTLIGEQDHRPGRPGFVRTMERLIVEGGHLTADALRTPEAAVRAAVDAWLVAECGDGYAVEAVEVLDRRPQVHGRVTMRVEAFNGVDRLETLVEASVGDSPSFPAGEELDTLPFMDERMSADECGADAATLGRAAAADPGVEAFISHYGQRLAASLTGADGAHGRARLEADFEPKLRAEVVGFEGLRYGEVGVKIDVEVDGVSRRTLPFRVCLPGGSLKVKPKLGVCHLSGRSTPVAFLGRCEVDQQSVLQHLLKVSDLSKRAAKPEHVGSCCVTDRTLLFEEMTHLADGRWAETSLTATCAVSGDAALEEELEPCDFTGDHVLPAWLAVSEISQKRYREDEGATCSASAATGHRSELFDCAVTGLPIAEHLAESCEVSGKRAGPGSLLTCDSSGKRLLPELTVDCAITGAVVEKSLTEKCRISGKRSLRTEMESHRGGFVDPAFLETCEASGDRVKLGSLLVCAASGKRVRPKLLQACAITGDRVLSSELVKLGTGERVRPEAAAVCAVSGERVIPGTLIACARTGRLVTPGLLGTCCVSGDRVLLDELVTLGDGRLALPEHLEACEASGRRFPASELVACAVTGKRVAPDLLVESDAPGERALAEALETVTDGRRFPPALVSACAISGERVPEAELKACAITGKQVHPRLLRACDVSGERVLAELLEGTSGGRHACPDLLGSCAITGARVPLDELETCAVTEQAVAPEQLETCCVSGKRVVHACLETLSDDRVVLPEHAATCEESGDRVVASELEACAVTGRLVLPSLLKACDLSGKRVLPETLQATTLGRHALPDLLGRCEVTQEPIPLGELEACEVTGQAVAPGQLGTCCASGKRVLPSRLEVLNEGRTALPEHVAACGMSGRRVLATELEACAVTGQRVLPECLRRCDLSGERVLPEELVEISGGRRVRPSLLRACARSGERVPPAELEPCEESGDLVLPRFLQACESTGRRVRVDLLATCAASGKRALRSLLVPSGLQGRPALVGELETCGESGRQVLPDELVTCAVLGDRIARDVASASEASGKLARTRLLVPCAVTGQHALPNELEACVCTGRKAMPSEMATSEQSGRRMLPGAAARATRGRTFHPDEVATCSWSGEVLPHEELGEDRLTGVVMSLRQLDSSGCCRAFLTFMNEPERGKDAANAIPWVEKHHAGTVGVPVAASRLAGPSKAQALRLETRALLGLKRIGFIGLLIRPDDSKTFELAGRFATFRRRGGRWEPDV
ncbi:DEAD/DEAH box helicase [Phycisphaera mikurensis]|uniref:Putative ATP-dependent helicase n=1 Tax=Phycisphaera mikurensis (strain NBRC 102666 / KCTC 22515 / FYK2301M01) TaxID=1142394 RepID=I0IJ56_PHYMF|nr:SNF2-related protein [Phycisphaera mikurensis]MBB6443266.1 superfamily II DNA or RNA helicase [Phycisphaera mikurensis]BAM05294.1 putative ATP-dependent helicase [Phycisphaera mikurensis NBRC 102666]